MEVLEVEVVEFFLDLMDFLEVVVVAEGWLPPRWCL